MFASNIKEVTLIMLNVQRLLTFRQILQTNAQIETRKKALENLVNQSIAIDAAREKILFEERASHVIHHR